MLSRPIPGELYKHFKGNLYRIVTVARHSETGEELVIYQALYGEYQVYARPLSMFFEPVDKEKYPEASQEYRFEKISELIQPIGEGKETNSEETVEKPAIAQVSENKEDIATTNTTEVSNEEIQIDPLVLEFLDAGTYEERLNILSALHHRITDEMITTMALSVDLEIEDGEVEERYEELKNCLLTFERYEGSRLR
ncbi:MAG: DUF1653 domain-containing protein [Lachnospiraceae bacterium]|nr:DUF1653 domain-containing protein [Lachnospiraceae bacterium]MBQ8598214.1 DUF1653 domain-containing protein [Lachnospiraceae bacterium]